MISFVRGHVHALAENLVEIDTGGLGYAVNTSADEVSEMQVGDEVLLHTFHYIREDRQELYGFRTPGKLELFELLISVTGVGPKLGLAILNTKTDAIKQAIVEGKSAYLDAIPGVGKKTAEKIVIELQEKLKETKFERGDLGGRSPGDDDVVKALVGLGFDRASAREAAESVDPKLSLEDKVKSALKAK